MNKQVVYSQQWHNLQHFYVYFDYANDQLEIKKPRNQRGFVHTKELNKRFMG